MLKYVTEFLPQLRRCLRVPINTLFLTAGIITVETSTVYTKPPQIISSFGMRLEAKAVGKEAPAKGKLPQKDGIYLYGQSPKPEQIGKEYMVMELRQNKVTGAFYLPHSEFSCFSGNLKQGRLVLTVAAGPETDSVDNPSSQQVAAASNGDYLRNSDEQFTYPYAVALQNYYQLPSVSENDRSILTSCKNTEQQ